jgi:hypothetical protein
MVNAVILNCKQSQKQIKWDNLLLLDSVHNGPRPVAVSIYHGLISQNQLNSQAIRGEKLLRINAVLVLFEPLQVRVAIVAVAELISQRQATECSSITHISDTGDC